MSFFSRLFKKKSSTLTLEEFGAELVKIASREFPEYQYQLGADEIEPHFLILKEGEQYSQVHFGELYQGYLQDTSEEARQNIFNNFVMSLKKLIAGIELEVFVRRTNIMPVIKPLSWLEAYAKAEGKSIGECSMVSFPLDFDREGDLCVAFAFDDGDHYIYVNKSLIPNFESSTFLAVARQNLIDYLRAHLQAETFTIQQESIGYMIRTDGEYEASLVMLMDDIVNFLELEGLPVIAVLARDILIVADSANREQVEALKESADRLINELDYALSAQLHYLTEDQKIQLYEC